MRSLKIAYIEEHDRDFIRWTSNLLRTFLNEGSITLVKQAEQPDIIFASIWRKHSLPKGIPALLVSNENWKLFRPHEPLCNYSAVLGLYPPSEPCKFIQYAYSAVHYDVPIDDLYRLREDLLQVNKTRFCCFVTSNTTGELAAERIGLFHRINQWQRVDSGGRILNNLNYLAPPGLDFLRWIAQYKYMICLENSKEPNYITEKPYQAWFAGTVPIYDGGCVNQLNQNAIVNAASSDVLAQLKTLELLPDVYEAKRHAKLGDTPISLSSFDTQFRAFILDKALMF